MRTISARCSASGSSTRATRACSACRCTSCIIRLPIVCIRVRSTSIAALEASRAGGDSLGRRRRVPAAQGGAFGTVGGGRWQRSDLRAQGADARRCGAAVSGEALRDGRRQGAHPRRDESRLVRPPDNDLRTAGPLRGRCRAGCLVSVTRHGDRSDRGRRQGVPPGNTSTIFSMARPGAIPAQ